MVYSDEQLVELYNSGLSHAAIAKIISKSERLVQKRLKGKVIPRPAKYVTPARALPKVKLHGEELDKYVIYNYNNGATPTAISKSLGKGKGAIFKFLEAHGIDPRRDALKRQTKWQEEARVLYASGKSIVEISKILQKSEPTISKHIGNKRTPAQNLYAITIIHQAAILQEYKDGASTYLLSDKYGYYPQVIQRFIANNGLAKGWLTPEWRAAVSAGARRGIHGSSLESKLGTVLGSLGLEYEKQFSLGKYSFDFKVGNVLIEAHGAYWHASSKRSKVDQCKAKLAKDNKYKLVVIWDFEFNRPEFVENKLKNIFKPVSLDFKDLTSATITAAVAKDFLSKFHLQGGGRSGYHVGTFLDDELVAVVTFSSVTRLESLKLQNLNRDELGELHRLAIHPAYQCRNLASWSISHSLKLFKRQNPLVRRLISFCDPTFGHDGTIYKASNWILDGYSSASYWYYSKSKKSLINKKSIWNEAKRLGVSEKELAEKRHFLKIHGHPKMRFIYNISSNS